MDQVIFGACIGLWLAFTLEFIVRKWMMSHIMDLHNNKSGEYLPLGIIAVLTSVGAFILLAGGIGMYYYCEQYINALPDIMQSKWVSNIF